MHNGIPEQAVANRALIRMSSQTGIPLVATNDAHYLEAGDASWHDVLLCVQTNATVNAPQVTLRRRRLLPPLPGGDVVPLRQRCPPGAQDTVTIAERCNVGFSFSLPVAQVRGPEGSSPRRNSA